MKKIITAVNNPNLNEKLKNENYIEVIGKDIQYKEGILEFLEKNKNIDLIIINEKLPGEINLINLLKKIKLINEKIKIILILENENTEKEEKIKKINNNIEIFFNNKINIEKLINLIKEKNLNKEKELEEEIKKLKEIIKNNNLEINNKKQEKNKKINWKDMVTDNVNSIKNKVKKFQIEEIKNKNNILHKNIIYNNLIIFIDLDKNENVDISLSLKRYLSEKNNKIIELKKFTSNYISKYGTKQNLNKIKNKKELLNEFQNNLLGRNKIYKIKRQNRKIKYKSKKIKINKYNKNLFYYKIKKLNNIKKIINNFSIFFDYIFIKLNFNNLIILNNLLNIKKIKIINLIILEKNINNIKILNKLINKFELNKNKLIIILRENKKEKIDINIIKKLFEKNKIILLKENKNLNKKQIKEITELSEEEILKIQKENV